MRTSDRLLARSLCDEIVVLLGFWYESLAMLEILTNSFGLSCRLRDVSVVQTILE